VLSERTKERNVWDPHISKPVSGTLLTSHLFRRDRKHETFVAIGLLQHCTTFL